METLFIYLLKSSGLVTLFFLAYYFLLRKETFSPVTVGFVGRFDHFRHTAFIGFHEDRLVEPSPATIDWSQIPVYSC
jgi:hypothetical protein